MYEKINQEILEGKERLRKRERTLKLIKGAEEHLKQEMQRKDELKKILHKEELDVRKLENLSVKGLFLAVLGNKEEKLDKEKTEFLAAKFKYDECCNSIILIESEMNSYYEQLRKIAYTENDFNNLMKKKEQLIMQANDNNTKEILLLTEEGADLQADMREIKEAIVAGKSVITSLENAASSLENAEGWGTWDMLGGGFISTHAKHSNIDDAVGYVKEAKGNLNRFIRELSDVNLSINVDIDISSFDRFADYFFDGLLADWNVQSKIRESAYSVNSAIKSIQAVVENLNSNYREKERQLNNIKLKINSIIECAEDYI